MAMCSLQKSPMKAIFMLTLLGLAFNHVTASASRGGHCRDRYGYFRPPDFRHSTCSQCLTYIAHAQAPFSLSRRPPFNLVHTPTPTSSQAGAASNSRVIVPDITNDTVTDAICSELDSDDCERWKACCRDAVSCCNAQLGAQNGSGSALTRCPQTWDGFSCIEATPAGQNVSFTCPWFIRHASTAAMASKTCTSNGTWWREVEAPFLEWTNYSSCLETKGEMFKTVEMLGMSCNALSILLLLPSIAVFVIFRQLREQQRIKLHIQLFLSLLLTSLFSLLWQVVIYNRLVTIGSSAFIHTHQVACKALNLAFRLSRTCTYFWMLCEGFQLMWLMMQSFRPLHNMVPFYLTGWGVPIILNGIYTAVRMTTYEDEQCWLTSGGGIDWIIYAPSIFCISMNALFLVVILWTIVKQVQSQPNEPTGYRRAMRATFILVPLFGLQQFFIIYRPSSDAPGAMVYQVVSTILVHSQGCLVALIFCICNGEVLSFMRAAWWNRCRKRRSKARRLTGSLTVQTLASARSSTADFAAMETAMNDPTGRADPAPVQDVPDVVQASNLDRPTLVNRHYNSAFEMED